MTPVLGQEGIAFSPTSTLSLYTLDPNPTPETILVSLASV